MDNTADAILKATKYYQFIIIHKRGWNELAAYLITENKSVSITTELAIVTTSRSGN